MNVTFIKKNNESELATNQQNLKKQKQKKDRRKKLYNFNKIKIENRDCILGLSWYCCTSLFMYVFHFNSYRTCDTRLMCGVGERNQKVELHAICVILYCVYCLQNVDSTFKQYSIEKTKKKCTACL